MDTGKKILYWGGGGKNREHCLESLWELGMVAYHPKTMTM